jgi:hypothetical protein
MTEKTRKEKFMKLLVAFFAGALLVGCSATEIRPQAQQIRITNQEPRGCKYLGEVTGNQGNFFTGKWTSNENLETGARNTMKNKAAELGGNVIVMLSNRAGETGSYGRFGGSNQQTNVVYTGTVYRCRTTSVARK